MNCKTLYTLLLIVCLAFPSQGTGGLCLARNNSSVAIGDMKAGTVVSLERVRRYGEDRCFTVEPLSEAVFCRMQGKSYPDGCTVNKADLRYIRVLHYDLNDSIHIGEMVCNKAIANDVVQILHALYRHKYPIERMVLIDNYGASDEHSMQANNSSAFCYRTVAGSRTLSKHSLGMAVDINPLYNPYVRQRRNGSMHIQPAVAERYADRSREFKYKIKRNDLCHKLFTEHGFRWGGDWRSCKDWQHFEK